MFRGALEDYRGSGFDRGHMAAAGNYPTDQAAMCGTFMLTNMVPQAGPPRLPPSAYAPPTKYHHTPPPFPPSSNLCFMITPTLRFGVLLHVVRASHRNDQLIVTLIVFPHRLSSVRPSQPPLAVGVLWRTRLPKRLDVCVCATLTDSSGGSNIITRPASFLLPPPAPSPSPTMT